MALLLISTGPLAAASTADVLAAIRAETSSIAAGEPGADDDGILAANFIAAFYAARDFRPAWYQTTSGEVLWRFIEESGRHGFAPNEFHSHRLSMLGDAANGGDPRVIAELEIVADAQGTDVDPATVDW